MNQDNRKYTRVEEVLGATEDTLLSLEVEARLRTRLNKLRQKMEAECHNPCVWKRQWYIRGSFGIAALVALSLLLLPVFTGNAQQSLYAQVRDAMSRQDVLHITVRFEADSESGSNELWFQRGTGFYWEQHPANETEIVVDNGVNSWCYSSTRILDGNYPAGTVIKGPSVLASIVEELLSEITEVHESVLTNEQYVIEGEQVIDGVKCRQFRDVIGENWRESVWLDDQNRYRRVEIQVRRDGQWQTQSLTEYQYDVAVPPDIFVPNLPDNALWLLKIEPDQNQSNN